MLLLLLPFTLLFAYSSAAKTLVLYDNSDVRYTHAQFFESLSNRGHELTFKSADDASLALFKYGEATYDNLVLMCPSVEEFGGSLNVQEIVKFIDEGGNVLIMADSTVGEAIRELANEVNFEFDESRRFVIDHVHYDQQLDDGRHTTVVAEPSQLIRASYVVGKPDAKEPILFKGVSLVLDKASKLTMEVLVGASTCYSYDPDKHIAEYPHAVGRSTVLIGAMQARNNARVLLSGSLDMFSDEFFDAQVHRAVGDSTAAKSGNKKLSESLTQWVFKESGVIRVKSVSHNVVGEKHTPASYTIKDMADFSIDIEEFKNGQWVPYEAAASYDDIQMEFVRIDPFVRATLKHDAKVKGRYGVRFQVPDVYGVYKFVVDYNRLGLSYLLSVTQISVRPFEHTQFERFIRSAFPYYASAFSMMVGLTLFSCVFLHMRDAPGKKE